MLVYPAYSCLDVTSEDVVLLVNNNVYPDSLKIRVGPLRNDAG